MFRTFLSNMAKRAAKEEPIGTGMSKKARKEVEAAWRGELIQEGNRLCCSRIKEAVRESVKEERPIILQTVAPSDVAYYEFYPKTRKLGRRVLNKFRVLFQYGHPEEKKRRSKEKFAGDELLRLFYELCLSREEGVSLFSKYFGVEARDVGVFKKVASFGSLPALLYYQECYGL